MDFVVLINICILYVAGVSTVTTLSAYLSSSKLLHLYILLMMSNYLQNALLVENNKTTFLYDL